MIILMEADPLKRLALLITVVLLPLWFYFTLRYRNGVSRLFSGPEVEKAAYAAIGDALGILNAESQNLTFSIHQLTTVSFRGEKIFFIKGGVGQISAQRQSGMSRTASSCVYAVADSSQSEWMRHNSDVFEPAITGSPYSVFWVRISRIRQGDLL